MNNREWNETLPEEELVKLAKDGNGEAEDYLIRKYKEVVKTKAHLYFMVGADRDDVVQEGMIGVFKAIKNYNPEKQTTFRTFADLCINRQIFSAVKQAARMKHAPLNTSVSLSKPLTEDREALTLAETLFSDSNTDPEAQLLLKEIVTYLEENSLGELSQLEYQVWMHYLQGHNYQSIAKNLGKSPKSIDNAIQRTKRKMIHYLEGNQ